MVTASKVPSVPINFPGFTGMLLSPLFIEGQPVEDLQTLYALNTKAFSGSKWNSPNQFWATIPRPGGATDRDVLEVKMAAPQRINRFRFQASNFPCRIWLQYWSVKKDAWLPVRREKTNEPVEITITKSVPQFIHDTVFDNSHLHPQHRGAGHWEDYSIICQTIKTARVRLVLVHTLTTNNPVNERNEPVDYSLAIQDFQFGYRVRQWSDIPKVGTFTQSESDFTSFSTSTDLLGSPVEFGMRLYRPSDLLWPMRQAQVGMPPEDRQDESVWKCEPQPYPFCVVNFFVDGRDEHGGPQLIDRFYVEPTTNGVSANLYYSNDIPDYSSIAASDDEIQYPGVSAAGMVVPVATGLMLPDQALMNDTDAAVGYLDLSRQVIQWAFDQPWWMGITFTPQFDSTDPNIYVIMDAPGLRIVWDGSNAVSGPTFQVQVHHATLAANVDAFVSGTSLRMVVGYDGEEATASYRVGTDPNDPMTTLPYQTVTLLAGTNPLTQNEMLAQVNGQTTLNTLIRFGGARIPDAPGYANILLENLVVKQEQYLSTVLYLDDPEPYLVHPDAADEDEIPDYTDNSILRVHPSFQTYVNEDDPGVNPYGFVGGPGNIYENLIWTPINRDFVLHKGLLQFDPVRAKYFKFEFTNLVPRPYATYAPVRRRVKMFSSKTRTEVRKRRQGQGGQAVDAVKPSGVEVNATLSLTRKFIDQNRTGPAPGYSQYSPVEGLYSADPAARDRLSALNPLYGQLPWHQSIMAPRFAETQRHIYEVAEIEHKDKVAFFVGLKQIRMGKVDYTAADDTPAYLWLFQDETNLTDVKRTGGLGVIDIPATVVAYSPQATFVGGPAASSVAVNDGDGAYMRTNATVTTAAGVGVNVYLTFPATPIQGTLVRTELVTVGKGTDASNVHYIFPPADHGEGWAIMMNSGFPDFEFRYWPNPDSPSKIFINDSFVYTTLVTPLKWNSGGGLNEVITKQMIEEGTVTYDQGRVWMNTSVSGPVDHPGGASGSFDGRFTYIALRVTYAAAEL
jgi:hypothetical protein